MDFIKTITQKVSNFLQNCEALDLVILGVIILIPILAIVFAAASKSYAKEQIKRAGFAREMRGRRRRQAQGGSRGGSRWRSGGRGRGRAPISRYPAYPPRKEFRAHYIEPLAHSRACRREDRALNSVIKVKSSKTDQAAMLATGIFGVGLGFMIHRAAKDEHRF